MWERLFIALFCASYVCTGQAYAAEDSTDLSDLVGTKIYSASKKQEDPHKSPSAIFVITDQDLKQMGVRHVADALRAAPGVQVAKISSNKWMVASRGFGEQFSNKLLVMLDGRPLYTSLFSGVLWFQQDIPIEDIKQIEVIRGPGATLWGSNAINGVINIITKHTKDTLGTRVSTTAGLTDQGNYQALLEAQYGQELDGVGTSRSTLKLRQDPSYNSALNLPGYDDSWQHGSFNYRFDSLPDPEKSYTITGSVFNSDSDQTYTFPTLVAPFTDRRQAHEIARGAHILGEWTQETSNDSSTTVRSYLNYTDLVYAGYKPTFVDGSLELQRDFTSFGNWETVAGGGYRFTVDHIDPSKVMSNDPRSFDAHFLDLFGQTKIPLIDDQLFTTLGGKLESSTYDDFGFSPSVKLSWEPDPLFMTWVSWSKAQRIPSRNTFSLQSYIRGTPGGYVALIPDEDFKPERLEAYEAGIRLNPLPGLQLDTSVFYNSYNDLRTFDPGPPVGPPVGTALYISNSGYADNKGLEISANYQTTPDLRLIATYSYADLDFKADPGVVDVLYLNSGKKWAKHAWTGRAAYSINEDLTFNASAFYYSKQPAMNIPGYVKLDANLAWVPLDGSEVIFGIDNLTDNSHPEYSAPLLGEATEIPRLYYVTLKIEL